MQLVLNARRRASPLAKMPSVAEKSVSLDSLTSQFPLTFPIPTPKSVPDLITVHDIAREEDLLRNPTSFRAWWTAIHATREAYVAQSKIEKLPEDVPPEVAALLGPLATPLGRLSLQRLTYLYEAALTQFAGSYKLWKSYLTMRMSFVLGKLVMKKKAGGRKKFPDMKDALEEEKEDLEQWEGGLHGIVGWEEWKALVATFERALMWLPKVRRSTWLTLVSLTYIPPDAATVVDVPIHFQPPPLPTYPCQHARSSHIRPRTPHFATISTPPHMGTLSALGGSSRRRDHGRCVPAIPCC